MKQHSFATLVVLGAILFASFALAKDNAPAKADTTKHVSATKNLNILGIGNSFTASLNRYFTKVVESVPGCTITFEGLIIGGCTLERHWGNIDRESKDPAFKYFKQYSYQEKLRSRKWDIVTIQQASHMSWQPDSYFPYAQNIRDFIHENAPQAEIVIQQTWSYRPDAGRLTQWGIDQTEMYNRLAKAYEAAAVKLNVRQIPVGLALQMARANQPGGYNYKACRAADYSYPNVPDMSRYFIGGNPKWSKDHKRFEGDVIHLNARGQYLQACVWFAVLYGRDANEVAFVPTELTADDAKFLRRTAQEAVDAFKQVNH